MQIQNKTKSSVPSTEEIEQMSTDAVPSESREKLQM